MPPPPTQQKQQKVLPAEVLEQIFTQLPTQDLYTCQYVCYSWHIVAKQEFYKDVEFKTSFGINLFLTCITSKNTSSSRIPSSGVFVKRLFFNHSPTSSVMQKIGVGSTLSPQHVKALAEVCPFVTTIDSTEDLDNVVLTCLLSLDDDAWKQLSSFPYGRRVPLELYRRCAYKFRRSIATLYFDKIKPLDFSYLCQFPSLTILNISGAPVQCMEEFDYVLNTCRRLKQLVLTLKMNREITREQQQQGTLYPTLKLLKIRTDGDEMDYTFLKYVMHKFNNLVSLEMYGMDLLDASLKDQHNFHSLAHWINSLKRTQLDLRGHDYNRLPQVATAYLSGLFNTHLPHMDYNTTLHIHNISPELINTNNCPFLVFSTTLINQTLIQRDINIQLPQFETDDRAMHTQYISQFAPYANELFVSYEGTRYYTHGCSWFLESVIQHCSVLRSIHVNYCVLDSGINSQVNESVNDISISNSQLAPDFFHTLSFCCPNLQNVTLYRSFYGVEDREHGLTVDMPCTDLDTLTIMGDQWYFPRMFEWKRNGASPRWVIKITTAMGGTRYFWIPPNSSRIVENPWQYIMTDDVICFSVTCKDIKKVEYKTSLVNDTFDL